MGVVGQTPREDVVFFVGGFILLASLVAALRAFRCDFVLWLLSAFRALGKAARRTPGDGELGRVVRARLRQQKVEQFRKTCQVFCVWGLAFTGYHVLNIYLGWSDRMYTLPQDVIHLAVHGTAVLICLYPGILTWNSIDAFYLGFTISLALWVSPIGCLPEFGGLGLIFGNLLMTILTFLRRSLAVVTFANMIFAVAASSLIWEANSVGIHLFVAPWRAMVIQCLITLTTTGIAHFFEAGAQTMIQQGVEVQATKEMLTAASGLLRSCCDVVEKLDSGGRITSLGTGLGGFLLRGPDQCLQGWRLSDLMPHEEDRQNFLRKLGMPRSLTGLAEAVHVRMKDGNDRVLQLELLLFQYSHLNEETHFLVGLREFSDEPVCHLQAHQQADIMPDIVPTGGAERMATSDDEESFSLPETVPVLTDSLDEPVAVAIVDCSREGLPIKACSSGFLVRFGRVAPETSLTGLVKKSSKLQRWVQRTLNALASGAQDIPDLCITLNMTQGPVQVVCRLIVNGAEEDSEEASATVDIQNVRIMFIRISRHTTKATNDTKGTPVSHLSL